MSLRFRLIALVGVALAISLALGGSVTLVNASRSVRNEMRAALQVARQTVDNTVRQIDTSPHPQQDLDDLVASFRGNRHLRVSFVAGAATEQVQPANDESPFGKVPAWFVRLVRVSDATYRAVVTIGGQPFGVVIVETDPRNEILEAWNELSGGLIVLSLFAGVTIPLIYFFIGRALRPLQRLTAAMKQVGQGDYLIRVDDRLPPELARLRDSFNGMASRLAATDADNRRLNEQLSTLQEEERGEIARDLHDEVGPYLFAINVDVSNVTRLVKQGRVEELPAYTQSISDALRHVQQQVRGMLGRLWPIGIAEFSLGEAVGRLVAFWQLRYPDIDYRMNIARDCEHLGDPIDTTIYRIIQQCLGNALRHGRPAIVAISVRRDPRRQEVIVEVTNDGAGLNEKPKMGYGLIGMEERARAIGGRLAFSTGPNGDFAVTAILPCVEPQFTAEVSASESAP